MRHSIRRCSICNHQWNGNITKKNLYHILKYQVSMGYVKERAGENGRREFQLTQKGLNRIAKRFGLRPVNFDVKIGVKETTRK